MFDKIFSNHPITALVSIIGVLVLSFYIGNSCSEDATQKYKEEANTNVNQGIKEGRKIIDSMVSSRMNNPSY
jgi:hypothetical protein